jgi:hypothetical protein
VTASSPPPDQVFPSKLRWFLLILLFLPPAYGELRMSGLIIRLKSNISGTQENRNVTV